MNRSGWIIIGMAVSAVEWFGVERTAYGAGADAGDPSLFGGGVWTSIWTMVVFFFLLVVLSRYAWKPLLQALRNREDRIRGDIQSARSERAEAEKLLARYQQQIDKAKEEVQVILNRASAQAQHDREQLLAESHRQAQEMIEQAKQNIEQAQQKALKELYDQACFIAGDLAAKILQREVNSEDHRILIQQGLQELEHRN